MRHRRIFIKKYITMTKRNPKNAGRKQKGYYRVGLNTVTVRCSFPYQGNFMIYGLASSKTPDIIEYIGFTAMALNRRYNDHVSTAKKYKNVKAKWVNQLLGDGHNLILVVLEEGISTLEEACEREQYYIQKYNLISPLKNTTKGGIGTPGWKPSTETRRKQSFAHKARRLRLKNDRVQSAGPSDTIS